jgi:hypothetical protein
VMSAGKVNKRKKHNHQLKVSSTTELSKGKKAWKTHVYSFSASF